jgi:hypothetical protein
VTVTRPFFAFLFTALLALPACDDNDACRPGEPCICTGGHECYLYCEDDGCDQLCRNLVDCGGVCQNDCTFECHDLNNCSTSCGDNCHANCHNVVSCEAIQGANSTYTCTDADRCGVEVGPGSEVICSNLATCRVLCHGPCRVTCDEVAGGCEVRCGSPQAQPQSCAEGTTCGC